MNGSVLLVITTIEIVKRRKQPNCFENTEVKSSTLQCLCNEKKNSLHRRGPKTKADSLP